jgi:hypothetical protein
MQVYKDFFKQTCQLNYRNASRRTKYFCLEGGRTNIWLSFRHENNGQIFPGIHHIVEIVYGVRVVYIIEILFSIFNLKGTTKNYEFLATEDTVDIT